MLIDQISGPTIFSETRPNFFPVVGFLACLAALLSRAALCEPRLGAHFLGRLFWQAEVPHQKHDECSRLDCEPWHLIWSLIHALCLDNRHNQSLVLPEDSIYDICTIAHRIFTLTHSSIGSMQSPLVIIVPHVIPST
jgi:hypothetical protein